MKDNFEKIQTGNQFVFRKLGSGLRSRFWKLGSGASSNLIGFQELSSDNISSREGVEAQVAKLYPQPSLPKGVELTAGNAHAS